MLSVGDVNSRKWRFGLMNRQKDQSCEQITTVSMETQMPKYANLYVCNIYLYCNYIYSLYNPQFYHGTSQMGPQFWGLYHDTTKKWSWILFCRSIAAHLDLVWVTATDCVTALKVFVKDMAPGDFLSMSNSSGFSVESFLDQHFWTKEWRNLPSVHGLRDCLVKWLYVKTMPLGE